MQLTRYSDYCLRVLIYLAVTEDELVTIEEISNSYDISRNHLMKVVNHLSRLNYIQSVRGKGGGISLHMSPKDINIGRLVRDTESDFAVVECFREGNQCCITPTCRLKGMLFEALQAFLGVLDKYTLEDAIGHESPLKKLLGIQISH